VLHQDAHLVAVDKPAGLLVHRTDIDRHETRFALQMVREQIGRRVWPVHRLDKGASGVLLFALDPQVARTLASGFAADTIDKRYLAVVRGWPDAQGLIDHPLRDDPDPLAGPGSGVAREAVTRFTRLARIELPVAVDRYPASRYALLGLQPHSGRRHQLRRHLKHIAHPIIGDATHGKGVHNRFFSTTFGCDRLLLACVRLRLRHPVLGTELTLRAPPSGAFAELLARFAWPADWPGDAD